MTMDRGDRFGVENVLRHAGVIRPGVNLAPEDARRKRPRNVDYFTPDPSTFDDPRDAGDLVERFADQDGRIRRLPVWFHSDDLSVVAPHGLYLFRTGGLVCRSLRAAAEDRSLAIRFDREGRRVVECDPERCPDHLSGDCRFSGRLLFYVPGQRSPNPLMLPTTSLNSFRLIHSALANVRAVRGSIRMLHRGRPFLELVKVRKEVLRAVEDGFVRTPQWLIALRLTVPMEELARDAAAEPHRGTDHRREPAPEDPGRLKAGILQGVRRLGIADEDMRLWTASFVGKSVREMDTAELKRVHDLVAAAERGDPRLLCEVDLARLLNRLGLDLDSFELWLGADEEGLSWDQAVREGRAPDLLSALRARAATDPAGLRAEVERVAAERRKAA
jgi:hypothetical protein